MTNTQLDLQFVSRYIEKEKIRKFQSLNPHKPHHKQCIDIINYVADLYIDSRTLKKASGVLGIDQNLLIKFLRKAQKLHVINYSYLKLQSKRRDISIDTINSLVEKGYSLKSIAKYFNMSQPTLYKLLREQYGCGIKDIKKKIRGKKSTPALELIKNNCSLTSAAMQSGIKPYELRKILKMNYKGTIPELKHEYGLRKPLNNKAIGRLLKVKGVYDKCLTLEKTAKKLNVSKERVRQLLNKGQDHGLFEYKRLKGHIIPALVNRFGKSILVEQIKKFNKQEVCVNLNISKKDLDSLLAHYKIKISEYSENTKKTKSIRDYAQIVDILGHHPSTTEMASRKEWRNVWNRIYKQWGSFDNFRKEFGINQPPFNMHPNTIRSFKKIRAEAVQKARLAKKNKKEQILLLIKNNDGIKSSFVQSVLNIASGTTARYLTELREEGLITRTGSGNAIKYYSIN
jgi:Mn-dependent DtxR family transcriptional regulator